MFFPPPLYIPPLSPLSSFSLLCCNPLTLTNTSTFTKERIKDQKSPISMVFSNLPPYLDPSNWHHHHQQQQQQQSAGSSGSLYPQLSSPPPPPPPPHTGGSIRPGSMSDRARLANIPMPEPALKCPRCESTNTKFCYFNNYSLSQPRHFCKTCRRYWTRGGALRSVPVGGGCRRNKRGKSRSSGNAGQASGSGGAANSSSSASSAAFTPCNTNNSAGGGGSMADILGLTSPLRFMTPFHHLDEFSSAGEAGVNYGETLAPTAATTDVNFPMGLSNFLGGSGGGGSFLMGGGGGGGGEQWRLPAAAAQEYPFTGGGGGSGLIAPPTMGLYPIEGVEERLGNVGIRPEKSSGSMVLNQLASVKIEDNPNGSSSKEALSNSFLGMNYNHSQYYWNVTGGAAPAPWTDLSGFTSSSATSNSNAL